MFYEYNIFFQIFEYINYHLTNIHFGLCIVFVSSWVLFFPSVCVIPVRNILKCLTVIGYLFIFKDSIVVHWHFQLDEPGSANLFHWKNTKCQYPDVFSWSGAFLINEPLVCFENVGKGPNLVCHKPGSWEVKNDWEGLTVCFHCSAPVIMCAWLSSYQIPLVYLHIINFQSSAEVKGQAINRKRSKREYGHLLLLLWIFFTFQGHMLHY